MEVRREDVGAKLGKGEPMEVAGRVANANLRIRKRLAQMTRKLTWMRMKLIRELYCFLKIE
ncbi:hypothetical protein DPMN_106312 [Dreissena polymorpha]|uniref:Uncharacterized protein n=1 Tax=Dreissena polymorpha TaxID=45954 RepID=A0A9D4QJL7_DREPO|nr:hypothetical protein DPMN_106312 [Dreissena polymorpha]